MTESDIQTKITENSCLLAYFSQRDCTVCIILRPKIEQLIMQYPNIDFQYVDAQLCSILRGQYMIFAVPTILLFYQGKEVKRWSRFLSLDEIKYELDRYHKIINNQ